MKTVTQHSNRVWGGTTSELPLQRLHGDCTRDMADQKKNGYWWKDGLLRHSIEDEGIEETQHRLVVPKGRRKEILMVAHNNKLAGVRKTRKMLERYFTWPGIARDVSDWVKRYTQCQKQNRQSPFRESTPPTLASYH